MDVPPLNSTGRRLRAHIPRVRFETLGTGLLRAKVRGELDATALATGPSPIRRCAARQRPARILNSAAPRICAAALSRGAEDLPNTGGDQLTFA